VTTKFSNFKEGKGLWTFVCPIQGIKFDNNRVINGEFRIDKVTLVDTVKVPRIRRRLGIPFKVSELNHEGYFDLSRILKESDCIAHFQTGGDGVSSEQELMVALDDELNILALSQLGFSNGRRNNAGIYHNKNDDVSAYTMFLKDFTGYSHSGFRMGYTSSIKLRLDNRWRNFSKSKYFLNLIKLFQNHSDYSDNWIKDIRNAAIMGGRSQRETSLSAAFLWNMIAIETLLTTRNDKYSVELPNRIESFVWWSQFWNQSFKVNIQDAYKARCLLVHSGSKSEITSEYLYFSDLLLFNIFNNLINNISKFKNKQDYINFSERIQAAKVLNKRPEILTKAEISSWNYKPENYRNLKP